MTTLPTIKSHLDNSLFESKGRKKEALEAFYAVIEEIIPKYKLRGDVKIFFSRLKSQGKTISPVR